MAVRAGGAKQQPDDGGLEHRDDDRGGNDQPEIGAHHRHVDGHADAHEEQRQQEAAERLDVGLELVPVVQFGEQNAGEEGAQRHRHAGLLHEQRRAQYDEQRGRRHHFARVGLRQQPEERIEQVLAGHDDERDGAHDPRHGAQFVDKSGRRAVGPGREQRQHREQRHHRHVLEQQDGEGALAVVLLELAALVQDLQRDGGRRHREREARDHGAAPAEQAAVVGDGADHQRRHRELRRAEAEDGAAHGDELAEFELEPDQEQQHHHAELGDRDDALGRSEGRDAVGTDDHAGDQVGYDGREAEASRNRHAQHRGREKHQSECQEAEFAVCLSHDPSAMMPLAIALRRAASLTWIA